MLLLWAFLYVGHKDPPAELAITQHAATQVSCSHGPQDAPVTVWVCEQPELVLSTV